MKRGAEDLDEVAPLFAALLSIPREERYGPLELTPQELGKRTNAALVNQVLRGLPRLRKPAPKPTRPRRASGMPSSIDCTESFRFESPKRRQEVPGSRE